MKRVKPTRGRVLQKKHEDKKWSASGSIEHGQHQAVLSNGQN